MFAQCWSLGCRRGCSTGRHQTSSVVADLSLNKFYEPNFCHVFLQGSFYTTLENEIRGQRMRKARMYRLSDKCYIFNKINFLNELFHVSQIGETGGYWRGNDRNVRRLEKYFKINEKLWMQKNATMVHKGVSCLIIEIRDLLDVTKISFD